MTHDELTTEISDRISRHMNSDHSDAIIAFAKYYAGYANPNQAKMIALTNEIMELEIDGEVVQIPFNHTLKDSEDAHQTLISMLKAIPKMG